METAGATDYTSQTPPEYFKWKKCLSSTRSKLKILIKCTQNESCLSLIMQTRHPIGILDDLNVLVQQP